MKSVYSRVAVCLQYACNFTKKNYNPDIFQGILQTLQLIIFRNIFICVEELNQMKDYMEVSCEATGNYTENCLLHKLSWECSKNFQNYWESACGEITFE